MLLSVLLLMVFCFNLPLGNQPKIVADKSSSGTIFLRNPAVYEATARELISKSFFNNNKLTINTGRIANELHNRYPELAAVDVGVPLFGRQPVINLEPAVPRMLLSSGSDLYVIDSYGRALLDAKQVVNIDKMGLPVVTDQSGLAVELGKPVVPSASVSFITEVYGQLKANKISVTSLTLPVGTNELDIRISGAPYFIKCNLRGNGRVEAGAYLAVKKQLEREHKTAGSYIDVRVEDRAYYK